MKSSERVAKFFGIIRVKESDNLVKVTGLDAHVMNSYIKRIFNTDILTKMMFTSISDTSFSINSFFIPDLVFVLSKVRMDPKCKWSTRRTIDKIVHGIMNNTWYKMTVLEHQSMVDPKRLSLLKWKPMPHQTRFLYYFGELMPKYGLRGILLGAAPGTGKAQPMDSLVRTPNGWECMGSIKIDSDIIGRDGSIGKVKGIYPQGLEDVYKITFSDNRTTECSDGHLWKVYDDFVGTVVNESKFRILTLEDIRAIYKKNGNRENLYIPLPAPEIKDDIHVPINPYLLGIILSRGLVSDNSIYVSVSGSSIINEIEYSSPNLLELTDILTDRDSTTYRIISDKDIDTDEIKNILYYKTIPEVYMKSSFNQKLALLQGFMDADATVDYNGNITYSTLNETLALQIQELIRSIGGLCKLKIKKVKYNYSSNENHDELIHILDIKYNDARVLFKQPSKKHKVISNDNISLRLRIKYIEYIGKKQTQCIEVSHDDKLYITDNYVVTHNTFTDIMTMTCVVPPSIAEVKIIISPKKALHLVWEKSILSILKKVPPYWICDSGLPMPVSKTEYYVFNFDQLDKAIDLATSLKNRNIRYFVSVDESHNFADSKSNRTRKLVTLQNIRDDVFFIWMSGTPILKRGSELISFLKCSDPRFDNEAERRFARIFSASPGRAGEIFNHRLGQQMAFLVPKSEVSDTKPTVKELPVRLPFSISNKFLMTTVREEMKEFIKRRLEYYSGTMGECRKTVTKWLEYHENTLKSKSDRREFEEYKKNIQILSRNPDLMLSDIMATAKYYERNKLNPSLPPMVRKEFKSALSAIKNIKLKVRGEALGTVLSKRRSECAAALGLYCNPEIIIKESLSKTLFFASSVLPIKTLNDHLISLGFESRMVYAGTNAQLTSIIEEFDNNPHVNPICATMQSLSEAVPVTSASTIVLLNRPFRDAQVQQVVARADRLGQKFPVTVIEVTLDTGDEPNVSSTTDDILRAVREEINTLVGPEFISYSEDDRELMDKIDNSEMIPVFENLDF